MRLSDALRGRRGKEEKSVYQFGRLSKWSNFVSRGEGNSVKDCTAVWQMRKEACSLRWGEGLM